MLLATGVGAQGYPERPVRVLVGYPPGGYTLLMAYAVPGVELTSWYGVLAPAGTPAEVIRKVAADVAAALAAPEVRKGFEGQGLDIAQSSPAAFAEFIRAEADKYQRIARAAAITLD